MKFLAVLAICIAGIIAAPLTSDQSALVKSTWNQVRHNEADILAAVFATYPDIQARFPQFVGKSLESIKDTAAFATHAGRIVGFVSEVVALLGNEANLPAVKTLVNQLGQRHKSRGIPQEQFNEFRSAILSYISAHSDWSDAAAAAWNQGIDNIYAILFSALAGNPVH